MFAINPYFSKATLKLQGKENCLTLYPKTFVLGVHIIAADNYRFDVGEEPKGHLEEILASSDGLENKYCRTKNNKDNETIHQEIFKKNLIYTIGDVTDKMSQMPCTDTIVIPLTEKDLTPIPQKNRGKERFRALIEHPPVPSQLQKEWEEFKGNATKEQCGGFVSAHFISTEGFSDLTAKAMAEILSKSTLSDVERINIKSCNFWRIERKKYPKHFIDFIKALKPPPTKVTSYTLPVFTYGPQDAGSLTTSQAEKLLGAGMTLPLPPKDPSVQGHRDVRFSTEPGKSYFTCHRNSGLYAPQLTKEYLHEHLPEAFNTRKHTWTYDSQIGKHVPPMTAQESDRHRLKGVLSIQPQRFFSPSKSPREGEKILSGDKYSYFLMNQTLKQFETEVQRQINRGKGVIVHPWVIEIENEMIPQACSAKTGTSWSFLQNQDGRLEEIQNT